MNAKVATLIVTACGAFYALAHGKASQPPLKPKPKPKQQPKPTPPIARPSSSASKAPGGVVVGPWKEEIQNAIFLTSHKQYAAVIEVGFPQSLAATSELVLERMREVIEWERLSVWGDAAEVPKAFPIKAEDASGRYWAAGVPSVERTIVKPDQFGRVWSRTYDRPSATVETH